MTNSRRNFLKYASLLAAGKAMGFDPLSTMRVLAQSPSSSYKALVCVFLYGGNDGNNMVVPYDATGYASYAAARGAIALSQSSLLPLTPTPNFALHPSMPELQSLYNSGNLAIVSNVGSLVSPITRAQYLASTANAPVKLFSHFDQQQVWQNGTADTVTGTGWGGRISDLLTTQYNSGASAPMIICVDGITSFGVGATTSQVSVIPQNINTGICSEGDSVCTGQAALATQLTALSSSNSLVAADNNLTANAYKYMSVLASATKSITAPSVTFPSTAIGNQMKQILQIIQASSTIGAQRQIFYASFGDFDTHGTQLTRQATLLQQLSQALNAFYTALGQLGAQNDVVLYTMSDFARTLQGNTDGGSDHGWGNHHLVLGGSVKGGQMYGTFPNLLLGGPDDCGSNGRWIPTTAISQYGATLAQWFGVPSSQLATVFPYISSYSKTNLGFV